MSEGWWLGGRGVGEGPHPSGGGGLGRGPWREDAPSPICRTELRAASLTSAHIRAHGPHVGPRMGPPAASAISGGVRCAGGLWGQGGRLS